MRLGVAFLVLLGLLALTCGADDTNAGTAGGAPRVQPISDQAAERYAEVVNPVIQLVAASYHFEALPEETQAGWAVLALYQAAKLPPPTELERDPAKYLQSLPGQTLRHRLAAARKAVGSLPAIRFEQDVHASLRAVFAKLDPHSQYFTVTGQVRSAADQRGGGVGMYLEDQSLGGSYYVRTVEFNSLAHRAGIRPGDCLLEVDRAPIIPTTPSVQAQIDIFLKYQRQRGVQVLVQHVNGEKALIDLSRRGSFDSPINELVFQASGETRTPISGYHRNSESEWDFWLDRQNRIAQIRLGQLLDGVPQVTQILTQLQSEGLKGLILDLRDCPSGYPGVAANLAGLFLKDQVVVASCKYRNPKEMEDQKNGTENGKHINRRGAGTGFLDVPVVVLVGPDTSGAAEMVAAALQDYGRAKVVGQRTRGKASIQRWEEGASSINHSFKLTVGVFQSPKGRGLHREPGMSLQDDWGVRPDVEVVLTPQLRRQVRAWWFEHDLLSPHENKPSPLDDPRNDPVLDAGLRTLLKAAQPQ